jgi:hypothetical protein
MCQFQLAGSAASIPTEVLQDEILIFFIALYAAHFPLAIKFETDRVDFVWKGQKLVSGHG